MGNLEARPELAQSPANSNSSVGHAPVRHSTRRRLMQPRLICSVLVCAVSLTLVACPQNEMVWVEHGSTQTHLVFGFGTRPDRGPLREFHVLRVFRCEGPASGLGAAWVIGAAPDAKPVPHLVYGQHPPPGYYADQGPEPLSPGCYRAVATTGGMVEFQVGRGGVVTVRGTY